MYIKRKDLTIPKEDLKELEDALPHGAKVTIARATGLSRSTVDAVFRGEFNNDAVIESACSLISKVSNSTKKKRIMIHETLLNQLSVNDLN